MSKPFYETKSLSEMTNEEWESLCDGCGKFCLEKLVFENDESLAFTNVACALLDPHTCRCRHYATRQKYIPECIQLRPDDIEEYYWLPKTCAYRLLAEKKPLPDWHPLKTGNPQSVHQAGMSAKNRTVPPKSAEELQDYIVDWDDL